jgi:hypothetical protein
VKTLIRLVVVAVLGSAAIVGIASDAGATPVITRCTSTLAPGNYDRVVVPRRAICIIQSGPVNVQSGLSVERGATFVLGNEENPTNMGTINGGVSSKLAKNVQIHFATINGGINLSGGDGPFGPPFDVRWNTIEDNHITGPVVIDGYNGFWHGFIRNNVHGNVTFTNNVVADPDGNEFVTNEIHGNLACSGNSPAPQVGDSAGAKNLVTGTRSGQCLNV